jgi:ribosomal protein S24E
MEIKKDFKNELFNRQELVLEIKSEKNPSFDEVKKMISDKIKKPEENIYVKNILGSFGNNTFEIKAQVYDSLDNLNSIKRIEMTSKARKEEIKNRAEAAKAKAEEAKNPPVDETPSEEPAVTETPSEEPAKEEEAEKPAEAIAKE